MSKVVGKLVKFIYYKTRVGIIGRTSYQRIYMNNKIRNQNIIISDEVDHAEEMRSVTDARVDNSMGLSQLRCWTAKSEFVSVATMD